MLSALQLVRSLAHLPKPTCVVAFLLAMTFFACGEGPEEVVLTATSVTVSPASATFSAVGDTEQLSATALDQNGNTATGVQFSWSSSDASVASVSTSGLVTAVGNGTATITATTQGVSGTADVTVSQVLVSVGVTPLTATLTSLGDTEQLSASALDANDHEIPGKEFTWTSSNENLVTISAAGMITAVANGTARITATTDGVSGTADVWVCTLGATIRGVVRYNGQAVTNYTNAEAYIWVRNEDTGQGVSVTAEYSTVDASYAICRLEVGRYGISVSIDAAEPYDSRPFPDDYDGWNSPVEVAVEAIEVIQDLSVEKLIHLTAPVDNGVTVGRIGDPYPVYAQGVVFSWDPIDEAVSYRVRVDRYQNSPYSYLGTELNTEIAPTQITLNVAENADNEHYEFNLYAYNASDVMVGKLMVVYENGHGWDYRFRVVGGSQ
jgi:hypothetical protein